MTRLAWLSLPPASTLSLLLDVNEVIFIFPLRQTEQTEGGGGTGAAKSIEIQFLFGYFSVAEGTLVFLCAYNKNALKVLFPRQPDLFYVLFNANAMQL